MNKSKYSSDKKSRKHSKAKKHEDIPREPLNTDASEVVMPGENTAAYAMVTKHRVEGYEMTEADRLIFREALRSREFQKEGPGWKGAWK